MFVLGVGSAHPAGELSDEFLASLGLNPLEQEANLPARFGVTSRRTSLPLDYIRQTKNVDVLEARAVATATPTTLGVAAAQQALARAGIGVEKVGLVIADTATPYQTCPSEAQRVAGALGIKVPAYDIVAGPVSLPLYLEILSSWKPERVADYVLCVSTNTLSHHVRYSGDTVPAYLFGDAATAFVLSPRCRGKLTIIDSYLERRGFLKLSSVVDRQISFDRDGLLPTSEVEEMMVQGVKRLAQKASASRGLDKIIGPQLYGGEFGKVSKALNVPAKSLVSGTTNVGYALGASYGVAMASLWDSIKSGEQIAILHVGDGMWSGSILLASE